MLSDTLKEAATSRPYSVVLHSSTSVFVALMQRGSLNTTLQHTMTASLQCICLEVTGQMSSRGCVRVKSTGRPSPLDQEEKGEHTDHRTKGREHCITWTT